MPEAHSSHSYILICQAYNCLRANVSEQRHIEMQMNTIRRLLFNMEMSEHSHCIQPHY